jgi:hypothetical protein
MSSDEDNSPHLDEEQDDVEDTGRDGGGDTDRERGDASSKKRKIQRACDMCRRKKGELSLLLSFFPSCLSSYFILSSSLESF